MIKGDIVLVPFPFTDLSGNKLRPAIVLIHSENDVAVAFITTQLQWKEETDIILQPDSINGLKKESLIRLSKLASIDKELIVGKLGAVNTTALQLINQKLIQLFQL